MNKTKDFLNAIGIKSLIIAFIILIVTTSTAVYAGMQVHKMENEILTQKGKIIADEASMEYNRYLVLRKSMMNRTAYTVKKMINAGYSAKDIESYLTEETNYIMSVLGDETTGLYGYINNEYVDGAGWVPDEDYVPTERPWYTQTVNSTEDIVFVEPYLDANTKTVMMTIAKRVDDKNIIALDVNLDKIQNIIERLSSATMGSQAFVISQNGDIVAHSDKSQLGKNYLEEDVPIKEIVEKILKNNELQFEYKLEKNMCSVYAEKLDGGWYSVSIINSDLWHQPLRRIITIFALILATTVLSIVIIFLYISAKNRKLVHLHNQVIKESERGDAFQELSETDRMTGLNDRISGRRKMEELLNNNESGMFLELDIDNFKHINDTYGHQAGDTVILAVADAIKNSFRTNDITMRLGGDEFGVFAKGITEEEKGKIIIDRFFEKINQLEFAKLNGEKIHISIGATLCSGRQTFDRAYAYADEALYTSKKSKGNCVTFSTK